MNTTPQMDKDSEVIAKRKALVHAFRAIHSPDGRVRVDVTLAQNLERAWIEYDAAVIANAQALVEPSAWPAS